VEEILYRPDILIGYLLNPIARNDLMAESDECSSDKDNRAEINKNIRPRQPAAEFFQLRQIRTLLWRFPPSPKSCEGNHLGHHKPFMKER
jgi:hypothetical protein